MRRPVLVAAATAVVSCGLLAVAIARGWLGPDVGRGANFCEAGTGLIRQPANTFSNVGFVAAGLLIAWHASVPGNVGRRLSTYPWLATAIACVVVLLGPGSAAMHATQSALGGHLDMLSMYLIASFAAAYAVTRYYRGSAVLLGVAFAGGLVFCELVGLYRAPLPVVIYAGNAAFGLLLLLAVVLELRIIRRGARIQHSYVYVSLGALLTAFAIWNASKTWLCDPHSLVQGHAIWHLLCAVAAYFLYRYYASESPRDDQDPSDVAVTARPGAVS
jgi:hypothetical protein